MPLLKIPATDQNKKITFCTANDVSHIQLLGTGSWDNVTGPAGCKIPIDRDSATSETMVYGLSAEC